MFRFTIRDVLVLTAIAGVSCAAGSILIWRADPGEEMAGVIWLFVFGAVCYGLGALVRWPAKL